MFESVTVTQQELHNSELRYRSLFECSHEGILILDVESGRIVDANNYFFGLLGFSKGEILGKTVGELSPFRDAIPNQAMLERLQREGHVRYENLPLETKDGRRLDVEFISTVYQAGDKRVIQCNIRDISERKATELQLSLLQACVAKLNDIVLITDADPINEPGPRIVFVNEAFERITGYTPAESLGRSPRFLQGKLTDRRTLAEIREAIVAQRPISRQIINYRKDGTKYWLDVDLMPIFDPLGKCTHFAAIQRDITAEKKSEARTRRLIDSNAQSVIFWNAKGQIMDANDSFLSLVGHTREELAAGSINWVALTPPEYAHLDRRALEEMSTGAACTPYEKEFIRKDGSRVPIILGAAIFEDNSDEGVCFIIDLTERRKLEKQFLRSQRMESIGTLAGGIAHDLNNILAPIMMSVEMLKTIPGDSPQGQKILETLSLSAQRGAGIVRQVLSFARGMDGERIEVQPKHLLLDLEAIVRDTFPKDISLEFKIPNDTWTILGDPTQVHQILLNLCLNARDAMPSGGSLTIEAKNCVLDEHYAAMNSQASAGRYISISVTDSGVGIPPANLDKIFEPFFTTKEMNRGTGLGLSTVMAIAKSHGGIVNVYSEVGKGTTFNVYLPAMESLGDLRPARPETDELPRGNGETILVVDDEASIRAITGETLQAFGYRVLTAADGAEGVAIYAQNKGRISVVITDMMMPIMGGQAMIHALRRIDPAVVIVASSGLSANGNVAEEHVSTVKTFLMKPYTASVLLQAVRSALDLG